MPNPLGEGRSEEDLRRQICEVGRLMHRRNLIAAGDGNLSCRLPGSEGRILATPTTLHKGFLRSEDMVVVDLDGRRLSGRGRPSSEILVHLAAYRERPDIGAAIHAHPPKAVACTLAGVDLGRGILPELVHDLGAIPTVPYAPPGSEALADSLRPSLRAFNAVLLARHGSVTMGRHLWEAYMFLERVEHVAEMIWAAQALGPVGSLPEPEIRRLLEAGAAAGRRTDGARQLPGFP